MAKPKVPNRPHIQGCDGRAYLNPAYYGFDDPQGNSARILERIADIKIRHDVMQREIASKRARIQQLENEGRQDTITAFVEGVEEFPDISEIAALKSDIQDLSEKVRLAKIATETLGGQLNTEQRMNADKWLVVLQSRENQLLGEWAKIEAMAAELLGRWREHASLCEAVTGERVSLDFAHPSRPIATKDPDDVVIDSRRAGAIVG